MPQAQVGWTTPRHPVARVEAVWTWLQATANQVQETTQKLAQPQRVHTRGQILFKKTERRQVGQTHFLTHLGRTSVLKKGRPRST